MSLTANANERQRSLAFALKAHPQCSLNLEWHLWINQVRPIRCTDRGPVLLVGEVKKVESDFAIPPPIKDAGIKRKLCRYLDRSTISDVNRTSDFGAETEAQAEVELVVNVSIEQVMGNAGLQIVGWWERRAVRTAATISDRRQESVEHARGLLAGRLVVQDGVQVAVTQVR